MIYMQKHHPNRAIAKAAGQKQYFTGIPCNRGHICNRFVVGANCVECLNITRQVHKQTAKFRISTKNYTQKYKPILIQKIYGLTQEQHADLIWEQKGRCKLCNTKLNFDKKTHIDHNEKTGKVRGILCQGCNLGIGHLKHDPKLLRKAALYCEAI